MTVRIGQLTDLHVCDWSDMRPADFVTKRLTGFASYRLRRAHEHSDAVVSAAVERLIEERPDLVVVSGDVSNIGMRSEMMAARRVLEPLVEAGLRVAMIPGNHDYYMPDSSDGRFEEIFGDWLGDGAPRGDAYPYYVDVGSVRVIMMNTAIPTAPLMAYGKVGRTQLASASMMAHDARDEGRTVMMAMHHHPTRAPHKRFELQRRLVDAVDVRHLMADSGVALAVHGHNHYHHARRMRGHTDTLILGLGSSSSTRMDKAPRRGQVGLYTFDDDGLTKVAVADWNAPDAAFEDWRYLALADVPEESSSEVPGT